jgi:phage FluMu protein gp41
MNTSTPSDTAQTLAQLAGLDDLYALRLVEGLPAERDGKTIRYKLIRLRETNVTDERLATRQAERVVPVSGKPTLLVSDADFRLALTARHCDKWVCDGIGELGQDAVDLDVFGKLNPYDLARIEDRVLLINLAAQLRHGLISFEDVHAYLGGKTEGKAPQPLGQTGDVGSNPDQPESGPALLTDFTGVGSARPVAGVGQGS